MKEIISSIAVGSGAVVGVLGSPLCFVLIVIGVAGLLWAVRDEQNRCNNI